MLWAAAHSCESDAAAAAEDVSARIAGALGRRKADLAVAFFAREDAGAAEELRNVIRRRLSPGCLAGVSASGVIASASEIEEGPALSVIAGSLPDVRVTPLVLADSGWVEAAEDPREFLRCAPGVFGADPVLVFADPFSFDIESALRAFNMRAPGVRLAGGMASAGRHAGSNTLFLNDWLSDSGAVAVGLGGALRADMIVSQGCRPLGPPLGVTRAERNVIRELDGKPAVVRIEEVIRDLPPRDQHLARTGLLIGRPAKRGASSRGDYLVRGIIGRDPGTGAIAIADRTRDLDRVRLHARDAVTAREDLELLLVPQMADTRAAAAFAFSCNGRGRNLYPRPDGDITTLQQALGSPVPAAGFFCAGEIGPVGGMNFLHSLTASVVLLRPR
jgi:small ligand-binding sensory domain FIST